MLYPENHEAQIDIKLQNQRFYSAEHKKRD